MYFVSRPQLPIGVVGIRGSEGSLTSILHKFRTAARQAAVREVA
jgi:hypothetical protein